MVLRIYCNMIINIICNVIEMICIGANVNKCTSNKSQKALLYYILYNYKTNHNEYL